MNRPFQAVASLMLACYLLGLSSTEAATVNWTNLGGGVWSIPANWNPNMVPGAADNVFITNAGTYTVRLDSTRSVSTLTLGGFSGTQTLAITNSGATFTLNGASRVNANGILQLTQGPILGTNLLSVGGKLFWTNGSISTVKLLIESNGLMNLNVATQFLTTPMTNAGTVLISGAGTLNMSAPIHNLPGATWEVRDDRVFQYSAPTPSFNNAGLFRKTGPGSVSFNSVPFHNSGRVEVQAGTLAIQSGGVSSGTSSREFDVSAGATCAFAYHSFNTGTRFTGAGTNRFVNGSTITLNGIIYSENLEVNGSAAALAGTPLLVGVVVMASGEIGYGATVTIASNSLLKCSGDVLIRGELNNAGTVTWTNATFLSLAGGHICNQAGALFELQTDLKFQETASPSYFENAGLFVKRFGAGEAVFSGVSVTNRGVMRTMAGTLRFEEPGMHSGAFDAAAGATNQFVTHAWFNSGSRFTGAGLNSLNFGTNTCDGAIFSENLRFEGNSFIAGTSTFSGFLAGGGGTLIAGAALTLAPGTTLEATAEMTVRGALNNGGTIHILDTGGLRVSDGGMITNLAGGLFEVEGDRGILGGSGGGIFHNSGVYRKSAGGGTNAFDGPLLINRGTLEALQGTLQLGEASLATSSGVLHAAPGAACSVLRCVFEDGSRLTGEGAHRWSGSIEVGGTIEIPQVIMAGGTLAGKHSMVGAFTVTNVNLACTSTVPIASEFHFLGENRFNGFLLTNAGLVTFAGSGDLINEGGAAFQNLAGGIFDLQNDSTIGANIFNNAGLLRRSAGNPSSGITIVGAFTNSGIVEVLSGKVALQTGALLDGGEVKLRINSATNSGEIVFMETAVLKGTLSINLNPGYLPGAGTSFELVRYPPPAGHFDNVLLPAPGSVIWLTNYSTTNITVSVANVRPAIANIADQTLDEETSLSLPLTTIDPDSGQAHTFTFASSPTNAAINATNGSISWSPTEAQGPSTNVFTVVATDDGSPSQSGTNSFTVVVREVNTAPRWIGATNATVNEFATLTLTNLASDRDLPTNHLSFFLESAPAGLQLTPDGKITWKPGEADGPGTNTVRIRVADDGTPSLSLTQEIVVVVRADIDLGVSLTGAPNPVAVGSNLTWTIRLTNAGPSTASSVLLTNLLPAGTSFISATSAQGVCYFSNSVQTVFCELGEIQTGSNATVRIEVSPLAEGTITNQAGVTAREIDLDTTNNIGKATIMVLAPPSLTIAQMGQQTVLSWPTNSPIYVLEQTASLDGTNTWSGSTNSVTVSGNRFTVTVSAGDSRRFFRLKKL